MPEHVFPQDADTNDAANFAQYLGRSNLTNYVEGGMDFTPDYTTPSLTISGGKAYVTGSFMYGDRSGDNRNYTVDLVIERTSQSVSLSDGTVNYVWLDANVDLGDTSSTDDPARYVINTTGSQPSSQSIKIGEVDTTNNTYTLTSRAPDAVFDSLEAAALDADVTTSMASSSTTTDGETIIFVDSSGGAVTITLSSTDVVDGRTITVVDYGGAASTNVITIDTEGSESIDGGSSIEITSDYGAQAVSSDGSNWYTSGAGAASSSISQDGSEVLPTPADLNFTDMTVADDGDNTVSIRYDDLSQTRIWRGEDGTITGLTLESGDSMTIPSDYSMVVGEKYTVDGALTVDGNLTIVDNEDEKPPLVYSTSAQLIGGSSPALDSTYTTTIEDASLAFDVIISPSISSVSYQYEYNYDISVGWNGSDVTVGVTVNWDNDPGAGNDLPVDIELYNRER